MSVTIVRNGTLVTTEFWSHHDFNRDTFLRSDAWALRFTLNSCRDLYLVPVKYQYRYVRRKLSLSSGAITLVRTVADQEVKLPKSWNIFVSISGACGSPWNILYFRGSSRRLYRVSVYTCILLLGQDLKIFANLSAFVQEPPPLWLL